MSNIWMRLKSQIKSVPGGTALGNGLRSLVHTLTGGAFGNGVMIRKDGENQNDWWTRIKNGFLTGIGAGASATQTTIENPIKSGVIMDKIKTLIPKVITSGIAILVIVFGFKWLKKATNKRSKV